MTALSGTNPCLTLTLPTATADSTHALPVFSDVEILSLKRMTMDAVGLLSLFGRWVCSQQYIFALCRQLKMAGANAKRYATEMIDSHSIRNRPALLFPQPPMSTSHFALTRQPKGSVSPAVATALASGPQPASTKVWRIFQYYPRFINLLPESLIGMSICSHEWIVT